MKAGLDNALTRFVAALRPEPRWRIKAKPALYSVLLAAGARPAPRPDAMRSGPGLAAKRSPVQRGGDRRSAARAADRLEELAAVLRANPDVDWTEETSIERDGRREVKVEVTFDPVPIERGTRLREAEATGSHRPRVVPWFAVTAACALILIVLLVGSWIAPAPPSHEHIPAAPATPTARTMPNTPATPPATSNTPATPWGQIVTPRQAASVQNCAYFSGYAELLEDQTLILASRNLDNGDQNYYVEFVADWKHPTLKWNWRGVQYFSGVGQRYKVLLIAVDMRAAVAAQKDSFAERRNLFNQGTILFDRTVKRVAGSIGHDCK